MIVPAALYVLVAVRPRRRMLTRMAALTGCFLIPVIGYLGWFDASHGEWNFTTFSGAFLYGRVADFASCQGLNLPPYEKALCPTQPAALRNADFYAWNPQSPQWTFHPPAGMSRDAVVRDFSLRILRHQPLAYADAVARDFIYGFSPVRGAGPEKYSPAYLQFHTYIRPDWQAYASIAALGYPAPAVRTGLAAFLTDYGRWFYVPGPVFAAGLVLGLGGLVIAQVRRRPDQEDPRRRPAVHRQRGARAHPPGRVRHLRLALPASAAQPDPGRRGTRRGRDQASAGITVRRAVRGHWPFVLVLSAGLALRVLTEVAYRPALLYIDSAKYLVGSGGTAPEGYQVLLRLVVPVGGLALVAAVQHAFGLAIAIAVYALLIRRRVPRWAATLAAAPVLLDAYQLQLEQTVMPDVLFETMIAAGLLLLLWPRTPERDSLRPIAAGVLVLGATATVREIGGVLIVPAVAFALLTASGWRHRTGRAALATACFVLPVLGYMAAAYFVTGHFGLASNGPAPEYGRAAAAADCATLRVPADERALCPSGARTLALGGIDGLLHNPQSPGHTVPVPPGTTRAHLLAGFSLAVFRQQPLRVAASMASDSVRLFALTRNGDPEVTSIARWQFQTFYPTYPHRYTMAAFTRLARQYASGAGLVAVRPRRHRAARLPAGRRLHSRPAVRGRPGRRAARIALRPGPAQDAHRRGYRNWPPPACW